MKIIICGAGEVGSHAAETLAAMGSSIIVIDTDPARLRDIEDNMDVATITGSAADAEILIEAGARDAELVLAATDSDEVNLMTASIAKGLGARKSIARVHDRAFFSGSVFHYDDHFDIDQLICPEYATSLAIARRLRNPGAVAIENFTRGRIEMQEFRASETGLAIGKRLADVLIPNGTRLALIKRDDQAYIPSAKSVVVAGDIVVLVGNAPVFDEARKQFQADKPPKRKIVLMGGPPMAIWLCQQLRSKEFSVRLFERDRARAEQLAEQLDWVTVLNADPLDRAVFAEENLMLADVFIALLPSDEANIIGAVLAKTRGVEEVITVVQQSKFLDIIYDIGVDRAYSTRHVAAEEIENVLDHRPHRLLGTLAEGHVDVFRVRVGEKSTAAGQALRDLNLSPDWVLAAIHRGTETFVPGADDTVEIGDTVLVVGKHGKETTLQKIFGR